MKQTKKIAIIVLILLMLFINTVYAFEVPVIVDGVNKTFNEYHFLLLIILNIIHFIIINRYKSMKKDKFIIEINNYLDKYKIDNVDKIDNNSFIDYTTCGPISELLNIDGEKIIKDKEYCKNSDKIIQKYIGISRSNRNNILYYLNTIFMFSILIFILMIRCM